MEELSQHSREVAKGSFWGLAGQVFFKLFSFFYVVLLARMASQEDVGLFYLALGIVSILSVFSDLGVSGAILRYIPYFEGKGEHGKIKGLVKMAYLALFATATVIMALLFWQADYVGTLYQNPRLAAVLRLLSAYILFSNFLRINTFYLQGMRDIKSSQLYQNIQNGLKLVFTVALFYIYGPSAGMIALAFILSLAGAVALSSAAIYGPVSKIKGAAAGLTRSDLNGIVSIGVMVATIQMFGVIMTSLDRTLLGYLTPPPGSETAVAVYSIATALALALSSLSWAVGSVFLPLVSRLAGKQDMEGIRSVLATAQRWCTFMTIPSAVVMMLFAGEMLGAFYGQSYASGAMAMALFTLGLAFYSISYMLFLTFIAMRMVGLELSMTLISGAFNVIMVVLLIPPFGMEGAAAAGALGFALSAFLAKHYCEKLIGFRFPPEIYKMVAAGVVTFALMFIIKAPLYSTLSALVPFGSSDPYLFKASHLAILGALMMVSVAIFATFALLLRCFRKEDVALMRSVMRKAMVPGPLIGFAEKIAVRGIAEGK